MRVLHVLPTRAPEYGGPIRVAEALCRQVARAGHEADVFPDEQAPKTPPRAAYWPGGRALVSLAAKVRDADLVHIHGLWTLPTSAAAVWARMAKRPYIVTPHGMLDRWSLRRSARRKKIYAVVVERKNLSRADALHFFNEEEREEARSFGIQVPTFLLPNGVDLEDFVDLPGRESMRLKYPETRGKLVVLYMGRIHPKKGLPLLLEALAAAVVRCPHLHLVIAGPDDEGHLDEVKGQVARQRLESAVTFTGSVAGEEKRVLLGGADLFALTSHQEGDSVAIKEALAAGLPVIITHGCHFPEVAEENAGAVVAPVVREIQVALESFAGDDSHRSEMAENARRLIARDFRWDTLGRKLIVHYEEVLSHHRPRGAS